MKRFYYAAFLIITAAVFITGCATTETPVVGEKTIKTGIGPAEAVPEEAGGEAFVVKEINYYPDGYIRNFTKINYGDDMFPISNETYNSYDELTEKIVFERLPDNEVKRYIYNIKGQLQSWRICRRDNMGNIISEKSYNTEGDLLTSSLYEFDDQGRKVSWKVTDGGDTVLSETRYIYENGNNTQINIFDFTGSLVEYFILDYKDGQLSTNSHYVSEQLKSLVEYSWEDGNIVKEVYKLANGEMTRFVDKFYDSNGDLVKTEFYDNEGNLKGWEELEYQYFTVNN